MVWITLALIVAAWFLLPGPIARAALALERWTAGLRRRSLRANDHEIVYLDGRAGVPLVLLHGFGATKENWPRLARHLRRRFRVIAPDLPGFGDSSWRPDGDYTIEGQVRSLEAFVDALGLTRFCLGGNSMGGNVAALYAARHPDRVTHLWLIAPLGVEDAEPSEMERMLLAGQFPPLLAQSVQEFRAIIDFVTCRRIFIPGPMMRHFGRQAVERLVRYEHIMPLLHRRAGDRLEPTAPIRAALAGFPSPVLVTWGEEDRVLHASGGDKLQESLSAATVHVMPDVGHVPMLEAPAEVARQWHEFHATAVPAAGLPAVKAS